MWSIIFRPIFYIVSRHVHIHGHKVFLKHTNCMWTLLSFNNMSRLLLRYCLYFNTHSFNAWKTGQYGLHCHVSDSFHNNLISLALIPVVLWSNTWLKPECWTACLLSCTPTHGCNNSQRCLYPSTDAPHPVDLSESRCTIVAPQLLTVLVSFCRIII